MTCALDLFRMSAQWETQRGRCPGFWNGTSENTPLSSTALWNSESSINSILCFSGLINFQQLSFELGCFLGMSSARFILCTYKNRDHRRLTWRKDSRFGTRSSRNPGVTGTEFLQPPPPAGCLAHFSGSTSSLGSLTWPSGPFQSSFCLRLLCLPHSHSDTKWPAGSVLSPLCSKGIF